MDIPPIVARLGPTLLGAGITDVERTLQNTPVRSLVRSSSSSGDQPLKLQRKQITQLARDASTPFAVPHGSTSHQLMNLLYAASIARLIFDVPTEGAAMGMPAMPLGIATMQLCAPDAPMLEGKIFRRDEESFADQLVMCGEV